MAHTKTYTEKEIAAIMAGVGCSREDAIDVWECDHAIDKGEDVWYENPEDKQKMKEALKAAHKGEPKAPKAAYTFKTRERKPNETKAAVIAALAQFLTENPDLSPENVDITNKEREIAFTIGGNSFSITLTQHRTPKN